MTLLKKHIAKLLTLLLFVVIPQACTTNNQSYEQYKAELQEDHQYVVKELERKTIDTSFDWSWLNALVENATILIIGLLAIALIIGLIIVANKTMKGKKKTTTIATDINIQAPVSENDLQLLLDAKQYDESIKMVYVLTLKRLDNNKQIIWSPSKTPIDYYYEVREAKIKRPLQQLTAMMLSVRYGNVEATLDDYTQAEGLFNEIKAALK